MGLSESATYECVFPSGPTQMNPPNDLGGFLLRDRLLGHSIGCLSRQRPNPDFVETVDRVTIQSINELGVGGQWHGFACDGHYPGVVGNPPSQPLRPLRRCRPTRAILPFRRAAPWRFPPRPDPYTPADATTPGQYGGSSRHNAPFCPDERGRGREAARRSGR